MKKPFSVEFTGVVMQRFGFTEGVGETPRDFIAYVEHGDRTLSSIGHTAEDAIEDLRRGIVKRVFADFDEARD